MKAKGVVAVIVTALVFGAGWEAASVRFERDIAVERQLNAERVKALEENYREKEREQSAKLAEAWAEVDRARSDLDALRTSSARMQFELDKAERRLSAATRNSDDACRIALAGCTGLLREADAVAGKSCALALKLANEKDAIVKIVK